jgi:HEPN domain-containing protein
MDKEKRVEWEGWIKRAISDYNSAKKLIDGDEKYLDTAVYHCQQAVEKILKSFLVYKNIQFEKVHSIVYLVRR